LKTAVLNLVRQREQAGERIGEGALAADIAAAFQQTVAEVLIDKTAAAAAIYGARQVCICGGVSANSALRALAERTFAVQNVALHIPPLSLCTDNAAMIGAAAYYRWQQQPNLPNDLGLDVSANLPLA
jgi:N6-L-threonylcarbamoyladenine synthase